MRKIFVSIIVLIVGASFLLVFFIGIDSGDEKVVVTETSTQKSATESRGVVKVIAEKKPSKIPTKKDDANAEQGLKTADPAVDPGVQDLIALIEDKKADPEKRKDNFERLKKEYPAEALAFARVKADEFSLTNRGLLDRMHMSKRRRSSDKKAEGDFVVGNLAAVLVLETDMRKFENSSEKIRYLIKTSMQKKWSSQGNPLIKRYCDDVDASVGYDFSSSEDGRFLKSCLESCNPDCMDILWNRHHDEWDEAAVSLKGSIILYKCRDYRLCNVDKFMQRLAEPNNEDDVHQLIIFNIIGWPWAHCIPYDEMIKKAEKNRESQVC